MIANAPLLTEWRHLHAVFCAGCRLGLDFAPGVADCLGGFPWGALTNKSAFLRWHEAKTHSNAFCTRLCCEEDLTF
eukprot:410657-Pleurochrysis_carterae.AAC.2